MKRYCVIPSVELASDSDSMYESFLIDGKVSSSNIYDRELQGVCLHNIQLGLNPSTDRLLYNIFDLIKKAYPTAVIPISPEIYEKKLGAYTINPTTNLISMPVIFGAGTYYFSNVVTGACAKYYGDLTKLYITFTSLSQSFRAASVNSMPTIAKTFMDLVYKSGNETKTYNVNEVRNKTQALNETTQSDGGSTTRSANTPEIITGEDLDNILASFISALSKVENTTTNTFGRNDSQLTDFDKTGTIKTDKDHEHDFIEILSRLKADLFSILDKIVNEIAITFTGVC